MLQPVKILVKFALDRVGLQLVASDSERTMRGALRHTAARHPVKTVVAVGASDGRWSATARLFHPDAFFLLIEAQEKPHGGALRRMKERTARLDYVLAAAGDRSGTIHFDAADPFGGVASDQPTGAHDIVVPVTTIDAEVSRRGLAGPFLLKLDTHGFEVPILEGARETLKRADLVVVEVYNFELRPGALRFHEMVAYLEERGLRCLDIVDVMHRSTDGALWQFDAFFVPKSSPEFAENGYE
ncbi:MAG TPA: FkbM family methyltransferase [Anaeromyxobacteraceae bacterium]